MVDAAYFILVSRIVEKLVKDMGRRTVGIVSTTVHPWRVLPSKVGNEIEHDRGCDLPVGHGNCPLLCWAKGMGRLR